MSDVLSNLVLRNGSMPSPAVLQPRLPSLFESSNRVEGMSETISPQVETFSKVNYHRNEFNPIENASFSKNNDSVEEPSTIHSSPNRSPVEHPRVGQNWNSGLVEQDNDSSKSTRVSTGNPQFEEAMIDINRQRAETVLSREEQIVGKKPSKDLRPMTVSSMEHGVHPHVESAKSLNDDAQQSVTRTSSAGRNLERHSNFINLHEEAMEAEPPAVRIHIGRIEVRAILPPAAQPTAKVVPAQPRMTLEEYLRQREGHR
jgi:hypothetical protein